ncbi:MAG: AAA family ATPase [Terriglobales bacterium]
MNQQHAATKSVQPFIFKTLDQLFSAPLDSIPYVVDGLLPSAGLSVLAGKAKCGKSTLTRQLAVAVVQGQSFLGRSTTKGSVLLFAIEEKESEIARHLLQLGARASDPIRVLCGAIQKNEAVPRLEAALQAEPDVQLVIIDPLLRFLSVRDGNDYVQVNDQMEKLLDLARRYDTHILTIHHLKKRLTEDPVDGALGSVAISAGADTVLCLRANAAGVRSICTRQRYGTDMPETQLVWDADLRKPSLGKRADEIEADAAQRTRRNIDSAMLDFVEQTPGCTQAEIFDSVTGNVPLKKEIFREFVETGVFVQRGEGVKGKPFTYTVVTHNQTESSNGSATAEAVSA